jgi:uncharacterized protein YcbX
MTGVLAHICRHPIKGHGREALASVRLLVDQCVPWDRHWAVAHDAAKLVDGWNPCANFARGAKAPALMALTCEFDERTGKITLTHPDIGQITFDPEDPADVSLFLTWVLPLNPADRALPRRIVSAGRGMTDSDFPSVSILSLTSLVHLSEKMGKSLSVDRWRGNLWLADVEPWQELSWAGKTITIGQSTLRIEERITRCRATMVDPLTGKVDADTLSALERNYGHQDFGVYARVLTAGDIAIGDEWSVA